MSWTLADTASSLAERFERRSRLHPDRLAVAAPGWSPTFGELDAAANGWANAVLERVGEGEGRVALLLPHDARLIAAALGALKAGKSVVALSTRDPVARLAAVREHAEPQALVTDAEHRDLAGAAGFGEPVLDPDVSAPPGVAVDPDAVAFLIYTSGSTGSPKGVLQTHRNMLHNVLRHTSGAGLSADDRVLLLAEVGSGQGVGVVWTTLLNGATLCPFPLGERGLAGLSRHLDAVGVTVFVASASIFRGFAGTLNGERLDGVRLVRLASEAAGRRDFEAFRRHFPRALLFNTFSASETGNVTRALLAADADPPDPLPVGTPAEGIELRLVRTGGGDAAPGETGEIVVSSDFLSPGYWRDPALTAERFANRTFRTGDLGRMSEDGVLTIAGRADFRVKVHGYNVDLAEVESALATQPGVTAAAVRVETSRRGDTRIAAFVSGDVTAADLRKRLRLELPPHAVPASVSVRSELPLAPSGKVDRARLAEATEAEELLAALWAEALELARVEPGDDFFELGGDSLAAAVIAAGVASTFGVSLELGAFADAPTVAAMARLVESERGRGRPAWPTLEPAPRDEAPQASYAQERVWRTAVTREGALAHTMTGRHRLAGPLDVDAFRDALAVVFARHEALRTGVVEQDGRVSQLVRDPGPVELPLVDLGGDADSALRAEALVAEVAREPFDLADPPLFRFRLLRLGPEEHVFVRVNHHVVSDGWSWPIFFDDLAGAYEALLRGEPPAADAPAVQYRDFAAWQRRVVASRAAQAAVEWWQEVFAEPHEPVVLPFEPAAPLSSVDPKDGLVWWGLHRAVSDGLEHVAVRSGATFYMTRLALFAAQVGLETGREDLVLGTYVTNRRTTELQALFGDFTNVLVLRLQFDPALGFRDWLARVRSFVLAASERADVPHELLRRRLKAAGVELPVIRFVFSRSHQQQPRRFGGLEVTQLPTRVQLTPIGFTLLANRWHESHACHAYFDPRTHERLGVIEFLARHARLAAAVADEPDRPLAGLT